MIFMVSPTSEGRRLYELLYKNYSPDFGAGLVGICGAQGSVKTAACLDIAEKKMRYNPKEIILWRETYNSPLQCNRIIDFPVKYFVEDGLELSFVNTGQKALIKPDITFFKDFEELYSLTKGQTLNVPFFNSNKSWTDLINFCNSNIIAGGDWQTIFIDEMEGLYKAGSNNQTEERWWDWMDYSGEVIKECRKSLTAVVGNYHDENLIDHRVKGKFMFFMYGFGAIVNKSKTRIYQNKVDQCSRGEFWIAHGRHRFGYICIEKYFPPTEERIIVKKI